MSDFQSQPALAGMPRASKPGADKQDKVITARGDIIRGSSAGKAERLAVGTTAQFLGNDGTDVAWEALPAASDIVAGIIEYAVQSEMETGTSNVLAVTPGRVNFHPAVAKMWIVFDGTGTIAIDASHNVTGIGDDGTGLYTITIATDFSSVDYVSVGMSRVTGGTGFEVFQTADSNAAGTLKISTTNAGGTAGDSDRISIASFGDQT